MDPANKRTSCYFSAKLGVLEPAVVERLERWATASCVEFVLRQHADACGRLRDFVRSQEFRKNRTAIPITSSDARFALEDELRHA